MANAFDQFDEVNAFDQFDHVDPVQKNPTSRVITPKEGDVTQDIKNFFGGAMRGAASIGNTIGAVGTALTRGNIAGSRTSRPSVSEQYNQDAQGATEGLSAMGVDTDAGLFQVGRLGAEIAGTAGVGGMVAPALSKFPMMANSVRTGGFSLGGTSGNVAKDMAMRSAGSGVVGGSAMAMVDPNNTGTGAVLGAGLPLGVATAGKIGSLAGKTVSGTLGMTTGAGGTAISEAFNAGKKGATSFIDNMRGKISFDDIVDNAKQGLANMRAERASQYKSGMLDISKDKTIVDFDPINKAVKDVAGMGSFKGLEINKNASGTVDEVVQKVKEWGAANPAEYHTPEGLDALKKAIGDIRDTTQFGTSSRRAVDQVYNAIKNEITEQAPVYAKVMKDYSNASDTLTELEKSLSLGNKANIDTSVRKLQSVLRNNANTNYGNRGELLNQLETKGGVDLMPSLAGQSLNSYLPRGMSGSITKGLSPLAAYSNPIGSLISAPAFSPRLVGEAAYKMGSAGRKLNNLTGGTSATLGRESNGLLGVPSANYLPMSILSTQRTQQ